MSRYPERFQRKSKPHFLPPINRTPNQTEYTQSFPTWNSQQDQRSQSTLSHEQIGTGIQQYGRSNSNFLQQGRYQLPQISHGFQNHYPDYDTTYQNSELRPISQQYVSSSNQYVDWWQNGRQLSINSNTSHVSSATYESTQSSVESLQQHFSQQMHFKTRQGSRAKKETKKGAQRTVRTPRPNSPRCQSRQPELDIKDQILIGSLETLNDIVLENILSKVNLEAIMFIDLDNIGKFFELLPKHLPETLYIVGFNGGDKNWKALHSVALQHHVQNGLFALVRCGTDKDAADKDLVTLAQNIDSEMTDHHKTFLIVSKNCGFYTCIKNVKRYVQAERIDSRIPQHVTFFILSGDGGFFNFIETANRHVQIQNPHKTLVKENLYHVILNHITAPKFHL